MAEVTREEMVAAVRRLLERDEAQHNDIRHLCNEETIVAHERDVIAVESALRELEAAGWRERVVEAAIRWRDDTAYEPPPVDGRQDWMQATWDRRSAAIDGLKAAIAEYESAPPGASDGSDK